jgi:alcohol dehydrogenase class IV
MAGSTFVFHNPRVERIVSGPGAIDKLAEEVERLGGKGALVVSSPSVAKTFLLGRITSVLRAKAAATF